MYCSSIKSQQKSASVSYKSNSSTTELIKLEISDKMIVGKNLTQLEN